MLEAVTTLTTSKQRRSAGGVAASWCPMSQTFEPVDTNQLEGFTVVYSLGP